MPCIDCMNGIHELSGIQCSCPCHSAELVPTVADMQAVEQIVRGAEIGNTLVAAKCEFCGEPLTPERVRCPWCRDAFCCAECLTDHLDVVPTCSPRRTPQLIRTNDLRIQLRDMETQRNNARTAALDWQGRYFAAHDELRRLRAKVETARTDRLLLWIGIALLSALITMEALR